MYANHKVLTRSFVKTYAELVVSWTYLHVNGLNKADVTSIYSSQIHFYIPGEQRRTIRVSEIQYHVLARTQVFLFDTVSIASTQVLGI